MACRQPFSRHRAGKGGEAGQRLIAAYEYVCATYGFRSPAEVDDGLSDEQLIAYLDAAIDRQAADFDSAIEAVRAGTIFARDQKAYQRWSTGRRRGTPQRGLLQLVTDTGGNVMRGGFEFKAS